MPSHTAASALIKFYFVNDGAPWNWPVWQHFTRKDADDIASYFRAYNECQSEEEKFKFSTKTCGEAKYPGRTAWNSWVAKRWGSWGVHGLIVKELRELEMHPQDILIRENNPNLDWPNADIWLPQALEPIALSLFGEDAFLPGTDNLHTNTRNQMTTLKKKALIIEQDAIAAFQELEEGTPTKPKILRAIRAVAKWKECSEILCTPDNVKRADEMLAKLHEMMESLQAGAKGESNKSREPKRLAKASAQKLEHFASEEDVSNIFTVYYEYFETNAEEEDDHPITEPRAPESFEESEDIGVAFEAGLDKVTLSNRLGFGKEIIPPSFNLDRPFLGGSRKIPSYPHLIVCPGTLVKQWVDELKIFFKPRSIDIFMYEGNTNSDAFWGPDGPLQSSNHPPQNRIVIASHSAVFTDFKKLHFKPKTKGVCPWEIPNARKSLESTIFGQFFLVGIIDEAHLIEGEVDHDCHPSSYGSEASMAWLVGILHFFTEESFIEEKSDATELHKAKKLKDEKKDDGMKLKELRRSIVRRHHARCSGHFMRRTGKSINHEGNKLIDILDMKKIIGLLQLTEREREIILECAEATAAMLVLAVGYAKEDVSGVWPIFQSLEEWEPKKSTKMDICAHICAYYLLHDEVDDISFEDGEPIFPDVVNDPSISRDRRIIVYAEFPSLVPTLVSVMKLYGVESAFIHGGTPFRECDAKVKQFCEEDDFCVLIFSKIGAAGLNLSIADVVIFFDQPWSAQDEYQIRGRAHRQPQDKEVKVIQLLALDSSNPYMYEVAQEKRDMFDAFVNKESDAKLRSLLQGMPSEDAVNQEGQENESELERESVALKAKEKGKFKDKSEVKRKMVVDSDEEIPEVDNKKASSSSRSWSSGPQAVTDTDNDDEEIQSGLPTSEGMIGDYDDGRPKSLPPSSESQTSDSSSLIELTLPLPGERNFITDDDMQSENDYQVQDIESDFSMAGPNDGAPSNIDEMSVDEESGNGKMADNKMIQDDEGKASF
ncbi:Chromodomain-helicase-DNA-binding protein 1-like protein [Leucoagaricus sp. SymC.cos]|nr:Chromodomain-helicase-DNA-binding protein 1-like protein [Leucoagaricus sp. SymC.cos]